MKLVKCISIRESCPRQIIVGDLYYLDETTLFVDHEGDEYAKIYNDKYGKQLVGHMSTKHFVEPDLIETGSSKVNFKEFMDMYDDWNGITVVNDDDLNPIIKDKTLVIMESREDLFNKEVVAFGFNDGEFCVRVR